MGFDKIFDLTAGVYFNFYNTPGARCDTYNFAFKVFASPSLTRGPYQGVSKRLLYSAETYQGTSYR